MTLTDPSRHVRPVSRIMARKEFRVLSFSVNSAKLYRVLDIQRHTLWCRHILDILRAEMYSLWNKISWPSGSTGISSLDDCQQAFVGMFWTARIDLHRSRECDNFMKSNVLFVKIVFIFFIFLADKTEIEARRSGYVPTTLSMQYASKELHTEIWKIASP